MVLWFPCPGSADYVIDDFSSIQFPGDGWYARPLDWKYEDGQWKPYNIFSYYGYTDKVPITDPDYMSKQQKRVVSESGLANVLGGTRRTTIMTNPIWNGTTWLNGNVDGYLRTITYEGRTGFLFLATGAARVGSFELIYDRGGEGLNLNFAGGTKITVAFQPDHLGGTDTNIMSLTLTDMSNNSQTISHVWDQWYIPGSGVYLEEVFSLSQFTGVNLAAIRSVSLYYKGDMANDAIFDFISTDAPVPVPPAVWLLGSGLIGLAGLRLRRK